MKGKARFSVDIGDLIIKVSVLEARDLSSRTHVWLLPLQNVPAVCCYRSQCYLPLVSTLQYYWCYNEWHCWCTAYSGFVGKRIFQEALLDGHMETYFVLASQFSTQEEPAFCGLTTLVMVLNALEVDPQKIWKSPWRWYHEQMLDCCVPMELSLIHI